MRVLPHLCPVGGKFLTKTDLHRFVVRRVSKSFVGFWFQCIEKLLLSDRILDLDCKVH